MRINPITNNLIILVLLSIFNISLMPAALSTAFAQSQLDSNNYRIVDPNVDSGGGASDSTNYSLLESTGVSYADARLTSGSYAIGTAFPNGLIANVPKIRCAETNTTNGTTDCTNLPNGNGLQGECGTPGCYDRAKIEIDHQNNPYDTLYLIRIVDTSTSTTYYVQSDLSLSTTYDINDYLTICEFEGIDTRDTACDDSGDGNYNDLLFHYNVTGLGAAHNFQVSIRALSGDFTETNYGPTVNFTTELPSISMDLDIGTTSAAETSAPHLVNLGTLSTSSVTTASNRIWLDLSTNTINGFNTYVKDLNNALIAGSATIPSENENLATDPNNNGGYGFKTASATQITLGPLQKDAGYDTGTADTVGSLTVADKLIFFTNTTGANLGQIDAGRASIYVKAKAATTTETGNYTDTATFTMVANP